MLALCCSKYPRVWSLSLGVFMSIHIYFFFSLSSHYLSSPLADFSRQLLPSLFHTESNLKIAVHEEEKFIIETLADC